MQGTELVIKALKDIGVRYVFGYTGGAIMPIFDEMEKQKIFNSSCHGTSRGRSFMAQGISGPPFHGRPPDRCLHGHIGPRCHEPGHRYRRCRYGLCACSGHHRPGPHRVIATDAFQESDVVGVMMPLTKQTYMPLSVDDIETTIHEAMYVAQPGAADRWWWTSPRMSKSRRRTVCVNSIRAPVSRSCPAFLFTVGGSGRAESGVI
jgi:acetolactate synthase-1/2/3 large subunit